MKKSNAPRNFKSVSLGGKTYPVFYNGRRVLILDSTGDDDFGLGHGIVLWDKTMLLPMGWADRQTDGTYEGFVIYGPNEISISGTDLSELAACCLLWHEWTLRH